MEAEQHEKYLLNIISLFYLKHGDSQLAFPTQEKAVNMETFFRKNQKNLENIAGLAEIFSDYKPEEIEKLVSACPVCKSRIFSSMDGDFNFCPECLIDFKSQQEILRIWIALGKKIDEFLEDSRD